MIIKLDLTFIPGTIRSALVKCITLEMIGGTSSMEEKINNKDGNDKKPMIVYCSKSSIEECKNSLKNILKRNNWEEFVVVEDTENENTLAIVKEGDIEQFGMYMCSHCGMVFKGDDERAVHERIHYFI